MTTDVKASRYRFPKKHAAVTAVGVLSALLLAACHKQPVDPGTARNNEATIPVADTGQPPLIVNHEAKGNLESTVTLGCIAPSDIKASYTPADLYPAVAGCIRQGNYSDAIPLFAIAGAYGRYDKQRVADMTARDAALLLKMSNFSQLPSEKRCAFSQHLKMYVTEKSTHAELCSLAHKIGPPRYYPRYMVRHGMGVFLHNRGNGLIEPFDPKVAWRKVTGKYLNCRE